MSTLTSIKVETPSGTTLDCVELGRFDAPAVLLVHGYSDSHRSYGPLLAELAATRRVIAVTLRGHGDSDKPGSGYGIADFAGDLTAVMDRFGVATAALVGHSMGSMVAARFALAQPDRVRALVLIGALATLKGNTEVEGPLRATTDALRDPVDAAFVREFQESTLARPVPPAFLDLVVAESLKVPARVWQGALRAMLAEDLSAELQGISVPTLILWGERDGLCDRTGQERLAAAISGARLSVVAGAGHAPHWEDPRGIAAAIVSFLPDAGPGLQVA